MDDAPRELLSVTVGTSGSVRARISGSVRARISGSARVRISGSVRAYGAENLSGTPIMTLFEPPGARLIHRDATANNAGFAP